MFLFKTLKNRNSILSNPAVATLKAHKNATFELHTLNIFYVDWREN